MFTARLSHALVLKKIVDSISLLVTSVNIDVSQQGLSIQAMDSSHVALVALYLNEAGFESYRSMKDMTLGLNV